MSDPADLESTIEQVVSLAEAVGLSSLNESDTKASIIEPVLEALGWNVRDPRVVKREYSTLAGKFADYALIVGGEPRLFVEAKDAGKNLYDDKWTAQVVSYANTEGIEWCVLTDGLVWRLFKANEPVRVDEKLAFQIDLRSGDESVDLLRLLTPESVSQGELHRLGGQLFLDDKVRAALHHLLEAKEQKLINLLRSHMTGVADVKAGEIRGSLNRILDGLLVALAPSASTSHTIPPLVDRTSPTQPPQEARSSTSAPEANRKRQFTTTLPEMLDRGTIKPGRITGRCKGQTDEAWLTPTGEIVLDGIAYATLSAAGSVSLLRLGGKGAVNGWDYWHIQTESGSFSLAEMREKHLEDLASPNHGDSDTEPRWDEDQTLNADEEPLAGSSFVSGVSEFWGEG